MRNEEDNTQYEQIEDSANLDIVKANQPFGERTNPALAFSNDTDY